MSPHSRRAALAREIGELPSLVEAAVSGLDDRQLDTPYREGGWTLRQVVHHLADAHVNGYARTRFALTEDGYTVKPYQQDRWAALDDAARAPLAPSLAILRGLHQRWAALLRALPEADWSRTLHHPEHGTFTVESFAQNYAEHGRHHVGQIAGLRAREGW